jgi:hypothetical protein
VSAATAERPGVQGSALRAASDRGNRQLMVNHLLFFFEALRCITQSLSIKQSLGQDVPRLSDESGGGSGA